MKSEDTRSREYFIDLYLKHYVPSHFELKIVPTYRCNLSCEYCYTRTFRKYHPEEMSWRTFADLIDAFLAEGGRSVRFLGGEPTLWGEIDRALAHLRRKGLRTFVLTNGTAALEELPDEVHLNIEHYYEGRLEDQGISVLESYRSRRALVRFRYNIRPSDPAEKIEEILRLAMRYSVPSLHLGAAWPHEKTRGLGRQIVDIVRRIRARGLGCTLGDPMPFCLFTEDERAELSETANFSGRCMCGHIPLVNPDGRAAFPCQAVGVVRPTFDLTPLRNVRRAFRHDVGHVMRTVVDRRCLSCRHLLAGECQGGCLGNRVGFLKRAADAGGLDHVVEADVFRAATPARVPDSLRKGGGWSSWRQGSARVSCRAKRGIQEFRRGDWTVIDQAVNKAPCLGVLLGLPGEVVALTPEGALYVQNLFVPSGSRLVPADQDECWLRGLVGETVLFDLGELEVLVAPAAPDDGPRLLATGPLLEAPLGFLAGRVTRLAGRGPPKPAVWRRLSLPGTPEVRGLVLDGGSEATFELRAARGTVAEAELADAKTYKPIGRRLVFHSRDGLVRHSVRLERARPGRRLQRCLLSVHVGGRRLATCAGELPPAGRGPRS